MATMEQVAAAVPLREKVEEALERLSRLLLASAAAAGVETAPRLDTKRQKHAEQLARFLGQVTAGWADLGVADVPESAAGFGSTVIVEDVDDAVRQRYTLMTGALLDIDAGQVSLASPVGQALLGARTGDVVTVQAPQRSRRLRVVAVRTLHDAVNELLAA